MTSEQAAEMQSRVNAHKTRHSERNPKTGTTIAAKAERSAVAVTARPHRKESPTVVVGIDPGTNTGFSVVRRGDLETVETTTIFRALTAVSELTRKYPIDSILVRFEDARLRTWFGKSGPEKWKGAGSIMRDCAIWEETITALGIPFEKVPPKEVKETTAEYFNKLTGWKGRTSIHAREAAWLVLGYLKKSV